MHRPLHRSTRADHRRRDRRRWPPRASLVRGHGGAIRRRPHAGRQHQWLRRVPGTVIDPDSVHHRKWEPASRVAGPDELVLGGSGSARVAIDDAAIGVTALPFEAQIIASEPGLAVAIAPIPEHHGAAVRCDLRAMLFARFERPTVDAMAE